MFSLPCRSRQTFSLPFSKPPDVLCTIPRFNGNIITDPGHVDIFPASRIPKLLHHLVKPIYRSRSSAFGESSRSRDNMKEKGFRIVTEPTTLSSVLQWASDSEVRKMAYVKGHSVPSANIGVLDKLIAAQHEIAQMYADDGVQILFCICCTSKYGFLTRDCNVLFA